MDTVTTTQPPPLNLKNLPQPPPSIPELRHISAVLSKFLRDYDDLHNHIGFINSAIDEKLSVHFQGIAVNFNNYALTPLIDSSDNNSVRNVLEGSVVDQNPRGNVSDDNVLKGVVSERKRNECVVDDDVRMHASSDSFINNSDRVVNDVLEGVVVTEGKCEGSASESESECERSDEDMRMYESDCDRVVNDVLEEKPKGDESDLKRRNEDVKNDEEIDASVKMEESDFEQSDYDVRMRQSPYSSDSCEETDDEDEEIGALKNAVTTCDEGEKIDATKNVEEMDIDRAINELLEDIAVIERNHIRTASKCDNVRKPQSKETLEYSEETDDADYDRIVTELLEDIDVVPKPNRTASDSDQSYDKPQSPTYLKNHLDEIDVSVNPEDKNHELEPGEIDILNTVETNVLEKHEELDIPKTPAETDVSEKPEEMDIPRDPAETDVSEKPEEIDIAKNPEETDVSKKPENVEILKNPKPAVSELERLCKSMSGLEMKKYVVKHISDIDKHQNELLKAIKLAINPAKLVLDSIGTYFLQSGKTYNRSSYQYLNDEIDGRQASLFILACFVMISGDGIEISREDEAYAAEAANLWKNRMIKEGGLRSIEEEDARGLLLLISGFGISDRHFKIVDIMELMRASNVKGISNILRLSIVLMPKIPEVIDMLVKKKLEVEAADIAFTFGLEDKCHPLTILTKFLQNVIDDIESGSPVQLEAMKRQLDDLVSVKECLESHNIDPSKVLPEFKIAEKIHQLKKELKLKFPVQKRKAMDIESLPNPNYGRWPGFPVCMPGHRVGLHAGKYPGYPGYFPFGGSPARRGSGSDLYGFGSRV
ncbi:frigida-like protein [Artemisia annua]|uniref:FRIGIDA-like protein n=1 Tax=Artemisia annua TaxID=35608 RepID=A0A2U1KJK3_ARTAN|nr:frigida-like protein [Artemisia annua]